MSSRYCGECKQRLEKAGEARCKGCVEAEKTTGRENKSELAEFDDADLDKPFAEGGFRWAVLGSYKDGDRHGQPCVCKWFKTGFVFEDNFYDLDIKAMHKARDFIKEWNKRNYISKPVRINIPEVWTFDESCSDKWKRSKVMIEPYIKKYTKFNSSSGWTGKKQTSWHRAMQALSHFSYHISKGEYVLCDLQGGIYSNSVVLTDPVILSGTNEYGPSDLGPEGISNFFGHHKCNEFCKSHWKLPSNAKKYFVPQEGTSMSSAGVGARLNVSIGSRRSRTSYQGAFPDPMARSNRQNRHQEMILPSTSPVNQALNHGMRRMNGFVMPAPPPRAQHDVLQSQTFGPPRHIIMPPPARLEDDEISKKRSRAHKEDLSLLVTPSNQSQVFSIPQKRQKSSSGFSFSFNRLR